MLAVLVLVLLWTVNLAALVLCYRRNWLRQVVLRSYDLLLTMAVLNLLATLWAVLSGQPPLVMAALVFLGLNLLLSAELARRRRRSLTAPQVAMLCAWWFGLLAMLLLTTRLTVPW
ncbi:MAG: hypothetical protein IT204_09070 [Fimbriimonadaceae bacterium]|nr:hypothetical protein [Fimbriimonadaceae bacterium]